MKKNKGGRPTVMTAETINKLEESYLIGASDREACLVANISMATLYLYCQANPEFSERKEALKDTPKIQARRNIVQAINTGDKQMSQWYAERKMKEEFSGRTELTGANGGSLLPSPEEQERVNKALDEITAV